MRFVPVRTEEQQANGMCSGREISWSASARSASTRYAGILFEYDYVFPQGISHVATLVALVEDPQSSLPGVRALFC
jgi:hypothetical protein